MAERILGRQRIAGIRRKAPPHGVTIETWFAMCRMAELYRQHYMRSKRRKRKPTQPDSGDPYLSEDEARQLLAFVRAKADFERRRGMTMGRAITTELAILLMVGAGLRVNEVCELKFWPNRDAVKDGKLKLLGKGVKKRTVAIGPYLQMRLQNYIGGRRYPSCRPDLTLLVNENSKPFVRQTLYGRVKTAGRIAGIGGDRIRAERKEVTK